MKKKSLTQGARIRLRPETQKKFRALKEHTGIPFQELADKAIDALLEKGSIPFPGRKEKELVTA